MFEFSEWLRGFSLIFISLFVQAIPFLLLGSILGVLAAEFLPLEKLLRILPRAGNWISVILTASLAALAGLVIPSCECVAAPIVRRLVLAGLPGSAAVAYLLASPGLNPVCLGSTAVAFSGTHPWAVMALRGVGSWGIAVIAALSLASFSKNALWRGDLASTISPRLKPRRSSFPQMAGNMMDDLMRVGSLYLAGCALAAALHTITPLQNGGSSISPILSMMGLAFLMSLCSSVDAFVAASFGVPFAAKMAFLWLGPVLDLKLLFVYHSLFRSKALLYLSIALILTVFLFASILQWSGYGA